MRNEQRKWDNIVGENIFFHVLEIKPEDFWDAKVLLHRDGMIWTEYRMKDFKTSSRIAEDPDKMTNGKYRY